MEKYTNIWIPSKWPSKFNCYIIHNITNKQQADKELALPNQTSKKISNFRNNIYMFNTTNWCMSMKYSDYY